MSDRDDSEPLCHICRQVNFAAILTPRAWDEEAARDKPVYRPEWSGNGKSPDLEFQGFGKTKRTGNPQDYLPQIRTAVYDDLSDSDDDQPAEPAQPPHENSGWGGDDGDGDSDDDQDGDSQDSTSTWSHNSHFTEIQRIDLEKQAQGDWNYRQGQLYYLGSIWDLRSRRHKCLFCKRLWASTRKNPDIKNEFLTKSRCILKLLQLKGRTTDGSNREVIMLNIVYIYGYKLDDPRSGQWIVRNPIVFHGMHNDVRDVFDKTKPGQLIPFEDKLWGEARWRDATCNYALFREWLSVCETKHKHPTPRFAGDMAFRLVDVQHKCLIEWTGPASDAPRYVTLSYVWGTAKQSVMLTAQQLGQFKQPGFFNRPLDKTIRDAIDVIENIGERYLWVDVLCILQDNPQDKASQIPQMQKIYGKAVLTIVAASGSNANSGLPGTRNTSRRGNAWWLDLRDIRLLVRPPTKMYVIPSLDIGFHENYLKRTTYKSRAWTFQEAHLSTRVLVFMQDQVYWECPKCTWCEEAHWESDSIDYIHCRDVIDPMPVDVWEDRFERRAHDILLPEELDAPEPPRNSYAALVKAYTIRYLSHDRDILNACMGVLSSITEREQTDFLFGLRTKHFGNDLLFNIVTASSRRFSGQAAAEFPTWSWASWRATIQIANEPRYNSHDLVENLVPCDGVKCYMLDADPQGQLTLQVINESGGWRFRPNYVRTGEGIYDPTEFHSGGHDDSSDSSAAESSDNDSPPAKTTPTPSAAASSKPTMPPPDIPTYRQDLTLADIAPHPAFPRLKPNFHIILQTFSSLVVVLTEFDALAIRMSQVIIGGTHKLRGDGQWSTQRDEIQRHVYAVQRADSPRAHTHTHAHAMSDASACEHCGHDTTPAPLPPGLVQGAFLGRLPQLSSAWSVDAYLAAVPDGVYRLLWMNNNQLPMFGHLLCRPAAGQGPLTGTAADWEGKVLERVVGVVGPTDVLSREAQQRYAAEWGVWILG